MLNTYYSKLLKLSFVVLLAMVFTIGFTKNISYAYNQNQYVNILANNVSTLPNATRSHTQWFLSKFIYTKDYFVFDDNNDLIIMTTNYYSRDSDYEFDIYYINLNGFKFSYHANGSKPQITFNGSVRVHRFDFMVYSNGNLETIVTNSTYNATSLNLVRANGNTTDHFIVVGSQLMSNTNYTANYSSNYYFKQVFNVAPQFVKDNDAVLNYRERSKKLGYIDNFTTADDVNFLLVDPNALYDSIIATVGDGLILVEDRVYVDTRKIRHDKIYDLYFYYNNELNEIYQYYWYYESGDSGYEIIDSTYDIIDNNNQNTQDIINNQNQNTDNIVNAIESGNNNVNDFLTSPLNLSGENISSGDIIGALDMNFSGDPYQNVWTTLIDGLRNCLVGVDREFDIEINNKTYTISLDSFSIKLPPALKVFLSLLSTSFMIWVFIRWIKVSIDKIQTANIDSVLELNEEEGIIDLF